MKTIEEKLRVIEYLEHGWIYDKCMYGMWCKDEDWERMDAKSRWNTSIQAMLTHRMTAVNSWNKMLIVAFEKWQPGQHFFYYVISPWLIVYHKYVLKDAYVFYIFYLILGRDGTWLKYKLFQLKLCSNTRSQRHRQTRPTLHIRVGGK